MQEQQTRVESGFYGVTDGHTDRTTSPRWALVLAGGDGTRMAPVMERWFGEMRPKQFCAFTGRKSMIEHTWERAVSVAPSDQVLTIAVNKHRRYFGRFDGSTMPGGVLYQPLNRGTATAIFFGLAYILARDPDAEVVILPSDHYIAPRERFCERIDAAFDALEEDPEGVILLAAQPTGPSVDYGWVEPDGSGVAHDGGPAPVRHFFEKPDQQTANDLFGRGACWSTMICVAQASRLQALAREHLPRAFIRRMEYVRELTRYFGEGLEIDEVPGINVSLMLTFYQLPSVDFSHDLLVPCAKSCRVMPLEGVEWDDWGRPERVMDTLRRTSMAANFEWTGG